MKGKLSRLSRSLLGRGLGGTVVRLVVVFALGFAAHAWWTRTGRSASHEEKPAKATAEKGSEQPQWWTCSMHPQIKQPKPGKCPICGMDLIPLVSGAEQRTALRQLVVSPESRALMGIETSPVERRFVEKIIRTVGKVDYDETRLRYITAWVSGRLDRLYVDYTGVPVRKGDHMVYIYSEELYAAQQELIEAVRTAKERGRSSFFDAGGIDLVRSAREKLRLLGLTEQQIAEIEKREEPSDHITIYAPIGGIVVEKLRQEGDRVRVGDRIYTIADLTQVWVKLDAYESDLPWVRYGQKVIFETEAYPGQMFEGRIAFIDPVLNEKTRTVKVRVNVPNPDGRLKPGMFVRATIAARVAAGGRVLDVDLAGKWMCPMHPEVVEEQPGTCRVCGMPLARPETLGFVTSEEEAEQAPLVIPASAALVTGTRAIVYVELPDTEQPTFEGREVVLGPRVGDYFIVRHGLKEGELVVTKGNFKIDSEIQIQARPSMMTPEGGAALPSEPPELPLGFRMNLKKLVEARRAVLKAYGARDIDALRAAFRNVSDVLQAMKPDTLQGEYRLLWKEMAMLLGNDAFEGAEVAAWEDVRRIVKSFQQHMERADKILHTEDQLKKLPKKLTVPPAFQQQLAEVWKAYLTLGDALASDDLARAKQAVAAVASALKKVDMKLLSDRDAHMAWMQEVSNLQKVLKAASEAKDLTALREQFDPLSQQMQVLATRFGFGDQYPVWLLHCPMAFEGRGAIWLQADDQTRNPYYGGVMLKCADRVEQIAGRREGK